MFHTKQLYLFNGLAKLDFNAAFPGKLAERRTPIGGRERKSGRERVRAAPGESLFRRYLDLLRRDPWHADEQQQIDQVLDPRVGRLPGARVGMQFFGELLLPPSP